MHDSYILLGLVGLNGHDDSVLEKVQNLYLHHEFRSLQGLQGYSIKYIYQERYFIFYKLLGLLLFSKVTGGGPSTNKSSKEITN